MLTLSPSKYSKTQLTGYYPSSDIYVHKLQYSYQYINPQMNALHLHIQYIQYIHILETSQVHI